MKSNELTHIDKNGNAQMVDIGDKPITQRFANAKGEIVMMPKTLQLILEGGIKKGDVFTVAKVAAINAAKRTSDLIPFCHPLPIQHIEISFKTDYKLPGILISVSVKSEGKTGVEMEALTAVSVAALTIYDMAKAVEKSMKIKNIRLVEKRGGQSGDIIND